MIVAIAFMLALQTSAYAQDLDEAIDVELDNNSAGGASPSNAPTDAPTNAPTSSLDDIQLDDGGKTATAPAPAPSTEPAPAIVDDTLTTEPAQSAQQPAPVDSGASLDAQDPALDVGNEPAPPNPTLEPAPDLQGSDTPAPEGGDQLNIESAPKVAQAPSPSPSTVRMDDGNPAIEKKLSQYSRGYKQVPDVNWDEITGDRRQENYSLQRGDTLWDISETFFGDGFFWAKLWSQNSGLENPHKVLRGRGIRFVAGTEGEAPAIGVVNVTGNNEFVSLNPLDEPELDRPTYREQVQTEVTPEEIESGVVLETDELIPAPDLPIASKRMPLLKKLPASFLEPSVTAEAGYDASGFKNAPQLESSKPASLYVNSMILDDRPDDVGKIDEIQTQERVASGGQGVFFKANRELPMGQRLTFLKPRTVTHHKGHVYDVQGVGSIDGVIKENTNTYHVTITTALTQVELGDIALAEAAPRITVDLNGKRNEAHVKILGGEYDETRRLLGTSSIIYLSGGANAGLRVGDIMGISAKRGTRRETKYPEFTHPIATLKIADVRENVATAYVVSAVEGIMPGDMTSGEMPEELPSLRAESADVSASAFGRKAPAKAE